MKHRSWPMFTRSITALPTYANDRVHISKSKALDPRSTDGRDVRVMKVVALFTLLLSICEC